MLTGNFITMLLWTEKNQKFQDTGLHVLHGVFKTGIEVAGWEIKKLLDGLFQLFYDSPARRSDYLKITGSTTYPKMFCATR